MKLALCRGAQRLARSQRGVLVTKTHTPGRCCCAQTLTPMASCVQGSSASQLLSHRRPRTHTLGLIHLLAVWHDDLAERSLALTLTDLCPAGRVRPLELRCIRKSSRLDSLSQAKGRPGC